MVIDERKYTIDLTDILMALLPQDVPGGHEAFPAFVWLLKRVTPGEIVRYTEEHEGHQFLVCFEHEGAAEFAVRSERFGDFLVEESTFEHARIAVKCDETLSGCVLVDRAGGIRLHWVR